MSVRGLVLLGFFVVSLPVCFFRPFYGIVLWTVVAFLNPQAYTWIAFDVFPWAMAVAIPTVAGMLLFERRFERLASLLFVLVLALWGWFTVTTLVSVDTPALEHHAFETWARWKFVSKMLLMAACTIPIVNSFSRLRYLLLTIAGSFGFYVVKSMPFVVMTGGAHRLYGPDRSMIADNNDFGLALNMTLPVYFYLAQTEPHRWGRRVFAGMFLVTIPAIFFTYSRGALVGLLAVLFVMFLQSTMKAKLALIPVFAAGLFIAANLTTDSWRQRMDFTSPELLDASALSRLNAWAYSRALAADYPVTGGGFATFTEQLYDRYAPNRVEAIHGPHSIYFQVLAEHGYVGLALYLLVVLVTLVTLYRLRARARKLRDKEVAGYAHMMQLSLTGFLVSGVFLGLAYFDYYFTIVACVIVLQRLAHERWEAAPADEPVRAAAPTRDVPAAARSATKVARSPQGDVPTVTWRATHPVHRSQHSD